MKTRDIVVGLMVLIVLISGVILARKSKLDKELASSAPTPSIQQKIEKNFPNLTIPESSDNIELKDTTGGSSFGIVTNTEVVANLPDLGSGKFYKVRLEKGEKSIVLGNMRKTKGGYIYELNLSKYFQYNKIVVSSGTKNILEGSF